MMIYPSVGIKINVRQSVDKENDSEDTSPVVTVPKMNLDEATFDTLNFIGDPFEVTSWCAIQFSLVCYENIKPQFELVS